MKKLLHACFIAAALTTGSLQAQSICDSTGNLIIYSNYDGGVLLINVDVNIPNLHIGVVSYEYSRIAITGTYAGNVTEVYYAGYNDSNNNCSQPPPFVTTISGAPNANTVIALYPTNTYTNASGNGYQDIICGINCDSSSSQGGCNTPDEIVHFFQQTIGGTLRSHLIQYNCWTSITVSSGGNCCIVPPSLTLSSPEYQSQEIGVNYFNQNLVINLPESALSEQVLVEVYDAQGKLINTQTTMPGGTQAVVPTSELPAGLLFVRAVWNGGAASGKIIAVQ
ncbi:MAG: T9SS type A sorting domain-containing protein [Bacteroidia bacterium]